MHIFRHLIRNIVLAVVACLVFVGVSSPAVSSITSHLSSSSSATYAASASRISPFPGAELTRDLRAAEATLIAQGLSTDTMQTYVAVMSEQNVVPTTPMTNASGAAGAVLVGDRLVIRGSFRNLSSPLRDYATDPVDPPNPNITSAFHIHQGTMNENGPFQYALEVMLDDTGRGGSAMGEYTLTPEQVAALESGRLYVDLHTTMNRAGELRGVLMPY